MIKLPGKSILAFLIVSAILLCPAVHGQGMKGRFALAGTGGFGFPVGDFADKQKGRAQTEYGWGGNLEYFLTDNLSVGTNFRYQRFGMYVSDLEEDFIRFVHQSIPEADTSGIDIDGHKSIIHLGVFGKYHFFVGGNFLPYIRIGAGWGKLKGSADQPGYVVYPTYIDSIKNKIDASYDGDFYMDLGGGVIHMISDRLGISGEVLFTNLATEGTRGRVKTRTQIDGHYQEEEEKKTLDYNSSYVSLFVSLSFFF
jgi:opacity protein-like surface antigen